VLFLALEALYGESPQRPPMCSSHLDDATAAILCQNAQHTQCCQGSGFPAQLGYFKKRVNYGVAGCGFLGYIYYVLRPQK